MVIKTLSRPHNGPALRRPVVIYPESIFPHTVSYKDGFSVTTIALHNLGCSKNQIDGEQMLGLLVGSGFTSVEDFSQAEIIIVNTCAFIQEAQQEAIDALLEMGQYKKTGACRTLVAAGCFSERFRNKTRALLPEVDLWAGVHDWPGTLKAAFQIKKTSPTCRVLFPPIATQHLKIAEGCSRRCSFCSIPAIRGPHKSRPEKEILREAKWLRSRGVKECILVSQDTSFYGRDAGSSLVNLLEKLLDKTDFPWIRLMYLHPQHVDDRLVDLFAQEKRLLPYFDIPLQHINDAILSSMRRRPLSKGIRRLVDRIRARIPKAAIRTTFIAGYPGETEKQFGELLDFVEWARFEHVGVFPYSPEEGTRAFSLNKRPRDSTAARRCEVLMSLARTISSQICASRIGSTLDIIVDGPLRNTEITDAQGMARGMIEGRTVWDAPEVDGTVLLPGGSACVGDIVPVTIVSAGDYDLTGNLASR
jgi:ribosomal protein S12 methylthiotransferase